MLCVLVAGAWSPALAKPESEPLSVTRDSELRFGQLTVLAGSAEVVVPSVGLPKYTNAVRVSGPIGPARFVFRGEPNQKIEITILTPASGSFGQAGQSKVDQLNMTVEFGRDFDPSASVVKLRLDSSGTNALTVGGRLSLITNNSSGSTLIPIPITAWYAEKKPVANPSDPGNNGKGQGKPVEYE